MSLLMKTLLSADNLYKNFPAQVGNVTIFYDCLQFYSTIPKILKQEAIATVP